MAVRRVHAAAQRLGEGRRSERSVYNFKSLTACEAAPPPGFTWALYSQDSTSENSLWEMSHIGEAHERACALLHTQGLEVLTFRPTTLSGRRRPLRIATNTRRSSDATSRAMRLDTQTPSACSRRD